MKKLFMLLSVVSLQIFFAFGQAKPTQFLVGTSTVHIEPQNSAISVALAGYGVPPAGRFSLTWSKLNQLYPLKVLTAYREGALAINLSNELLMGTPGTPIVSWKQIEGTEVLSALASSEKSLYAVNSDGELLNGKLGKKRINWNKIDQPHVLSLLTSFNDKLYAKNRANELLEGDIKGSKIEWRTLGSAKNIISLTSDDRLLYALTDKSTIFSIKPGADKVVWTTIARDNGVTFNEKLNQIAIVDKVIYGLNKEYELLKGKHKSENNLAVNSLAIKNNDETVVIVGIDLCGFDGSFISGIKDYIFQTRGIPPAAILVNASHTHFAPVTQSWATWADFYQVPDTSYLNNVVKEGVIQSIEEALDNLEPSNMMFGRSATAIGANRRNTALLVRPYDNTLDMLKIVNANNELKSVLFSAGCHPVYENKGEQSYTISGNYPSIARQALEKDLHVNHSLFLQGCGGDINPVDSDYRKTGETLASDVKNILSASLQELDQGISFYIDTVEIPVEPWSIDEINKFKDQNLSMVATIETEKNVRWANLMLERYDENKVENHLPIYVQTINIGQWKLVGLSREAVTEYGIEIRKLWPDKLVTVAGYCNDVSSYLPNDWHIEANAYEGHGSFFWYGQPGLPPLDILPRIVTSIKENNR